MVRYAFFVGNNLAKNIMCKGKDEKHNVCIGCSERIIFSELQAKN
jgi:hypothetical protein